MARSKTYLVLLPTRSEGVDYGYLAPVMVRGTDDQDAIKNAAEKWWGTTPHEGTAIVVKHGETNAYVLGEIRGVNIVAKTNVPNLLSESSR